MFQAKLRKKAKLLCTAQEFQNNVISKQGYHFVGNGQFSLGVQKVIFGGFDKK
jgi:hypothetical protein